MHLIRIRRLLKHYDNRNFILKWLDKEEPEVLALRHFLNALKTKEDDYLLTSSEILILLKIIHVDSDLKLIQSLRELFSEDHLWSVFSTLANANLVNDRNFPQISAKDNLFILHQLFVQPYIAVRPTSEMLAFALYFLNRKKFEYDPAFVDCLRFLQFKKQAHSTSFSLIDDNRDQLASLYKLFTAMDKRHCLDMENLRLLCLQQHITLIPGILRQLKRLGVMVDRANLRALLRINRDLSDLSDLLLLLQNANQKNNPLTHDLTRRLSKDILLHRFIYDQCLQLLMYAHDEKLLDQAMMKYCLSFLLHQTKSRTRSLNAAFTRIIVMLKQTHCHLDQASLLGLLRLSDQNILRLYSKVDRLETYHLLDAASFAEIFQRITCKLPQLTDVDLIKRSRKTLNQPRSEITLSNSMMMPLRFFLEHDDQKDYHRGGAGQIKKAYPTLDSKQALYSIKKICLSVENPTSNEIKHEARHETKFHQLLGRKALCYFRKDAAYVVSPWHQGKSVYHHEQDNKVTDKLVTISQKDRFRAVLSGLRELNILHVNYRIHGDIKPENCIYNPATHCINLIDFGGSHKKRSGRNVYHTKLYAHPDDITGHKFSRDLWGMGIVIMTLFPDIFTLDYTKHNCTHTIKPCSAATEQAIRLLVLAMMTPLHRVRCTTLDAINYSESILKEWDTLDMSVIYILSASTICHSKPTAEDIMRDARYSKRLPARKI